jgi:polysaccharide export outer membrane protein
MERMKITRKTSAVLVGVLLWAACSCLFAADDKVAAKNLASPSVDVAANSETFVIGPEDVLQISVWKEAELSGQLPVRSDGKISLALLNDIQAAGLTPMQLADSIAEKLKKYISDPQVSVVVRQINSRKYYLLGEVKKPGMFPLSTDMTVLQALSAAGGFSDFADLAKIYVLRQENGKPVKYHFNYKQVVKGEAIEQNRLLKPNDTIVVP